MYLQNPPQTPTACNSVSPDPRVPCSPSLDLVAVVFGPDQQPGHVAQHAHQLPAADGAPVILLPTATGDPGHLRGDGGRKGDNEET